MNGARTTFMREGYWLTALATAVLLAASPGTALAQTTTASVGFDRDSTSVTEGDEDPAILKVVRTAIADEDLVGLMVTIRVGTAMPAGSSGLNFTIDAEGGTVGSNGSGTTTVLPGASVPVAFTGDSAEVVLSISQPEADGNWADASFNLALVSGNADITVTRSRAVVHILDANPQPVAMFDKSSITLNEDSSTTVKVSVDGDDEPAADLATIMAELALVVEPADAFNADGPLAVAINSMLLTEDDIDKGSFDVGKILTLSKVAVELTIMATPDIAGYKSPVITLSFDPDSLEPDAGDITDGGSLVINIASDEPVPTVSFSPTDVTVDEGDSVDTLLISEGEFGSEVMSVTLSVKDGDALVGLYKGMTKLEAEADGSIVVDLGLSNSVRLTGKSYADPDLMDGETKFIAWEITDADGANIGDGYWFRVDVNGSSAVPEPEPEDLVVTLSADPMEIEAGGMSTITAMANRAVTADDDAVTIDLTVDGDGALDPESITIAMGEMSGSAMLTATESVTVVATGSGISGEEQVMVTVTDAVPEPEPEDLVVTLSADPMEIEAGGMSTITAMANRAVTADDDAVTIDLTVDGDGALDPESITIAMGEMSGSAMLTATESVTVVATGSGISGEEQVMVTVTDAVPVPALPLIAQWLLGLGLMGGGARQLFRRRRQG